MFFFRKKQTAQPESMLPPSPEPLCRQTAPLPEPPHVEDFPLKESQAPSVALEMGPLFQRFNYPALLPLEEGYTTFGRAQDCTIQLPASFQSGAPTAPLARRHCALYYKNGTLYLRDTGSNYGTFINRLQIPGNSWVTVPDNAEICLGSTEIRFIVHYTL